MLASMITSSWEAVPRKATTMPRPATCHTPNCCGTSSSWPLLDASLQATQCSAMLQQRISEDPGFRLRIQGKDA